MGRHAGLVQRFPLSVPVELVQIREFAEVPLPVVFLSVRFLGQLKKRFVACFLVLPLNADMQLPPTEPSPTGKRRVVEDLPDFGKNPGHSRHDPIITGYIVVLSRGFHEDKNRPGIIFITDLLIDDRSQPAVFMLMINDVADPQFHALDKVAVVEQIRERHYTVKPVRPAFSSFPVSAYPGGDLQFRPEVLEMPR